MPCVPTAFMAKTQPFFAVLRYDPTKLTDGFNDVDGERVFYVSNPALGLWAYKGRFESA